MDKARSKNVFFVVVFVSGWFILVCLGFFWVFFRGSSTVIEDCKLQLYLK